jgi:FkbM family methyltransferase
MANPAWSLETEEYEYACRNIERLRQLVASGREHEDTVRFEVTTPKFIELAREARVFVDAGAEFGLYTFLALREMRQPLELHLFEPDPPRHRALCTYWAEDRRVHVHAEALSDRAGTLALHKPAHTMSVTLDPAISEHTAKSSQHCYALHCTPLDTLQTAAPIDLLKMDIEGAELFALQGMRRILSQDRPRILLEKHRKYIEALDPLGVHKMVQLLSEYEYDTFACDSGGLRRVVGWIPGRAYLCPRELAA